MTSEEMKGKLSDLLAEGADVGAITNEIMTDYSERLNEIAGIKTKDDQINDLVGKIAQLNETNLKLVNRIKYQDDVKEEPEKPKVTLENLFD